MITVVTVVDGSSPTRLCRECTFQNVRVKKTMREEKIRSEWRRIQLLSLER